MLKNRELIRLRGFLLLFPFLFFSLICLGQRARLFTTDFELSNSLIKDLHQDSKGIIWIATDDGINSYDGSKFTVYREKEGALFKNVRVIFEDSQNNLFFGYSEGLQIYHHDSDSFETIPLILADNSVLPTFILSMAERQDGTLLVGTSGQGIFSLTKKNGKFEAHQRLELVPSLLVNQLFEDTYQNLWVSTQDKGLFQIRSNGSLRSYYGPKNDLDNNVESLCQDYHGDIYAGSLGKGLFKYNKKDDSFDQIPYTGFSPPPVKVLFPLESSKLFIGTDGEGMKIYDPEKNQISNLNFNVSNFDFSKSKVHAIMEDDDGNTWLGLYQKGVALIPSQPNNFKYIGYQSVTNNIIGSNYIMSVFRDHNEILWVGTDSDGLYKISPDGVQLAHLAPSEKSNSAPSTIMCIFEDSDNNLWIGSYLKGLAKFNPDTGTFDYMTDLLNDQLNPVYRIYSIIEDGQKNLWIGTLGFGLYSMNLRTGIIKNYSSNPNPVHPNDATNTLHSSWISNLLLSQDEKLYIGTADGISCFDPKTKTFTNLNTKYPILSQGTETLKEDYLGRIWIGTSQGLLCLDVHNEIISSFTMDDGLPNDVICAIETDKEQNLWISTNLGISKLNLRDTSFVNYFFHDGLQGNEFSKRAGFSGKDGEIIFGGINGVTYFNPEEIIDNIRNPEVSITGFYIHNVAVKKGTKSGKHNVINASVRDSDTFQLSYEDNSFSIEFSTMEFLNPRRITYLYSINDNDWINLQPGTNTVSFNNLSPGEYNFKVKAKDFSTYSNSKEITIVIHPAWYLSIWAKTGYIFILLLIIFGIVLYIRQRLDTRKKMRDHMIAEQIKEAKLEFFTNISHEIRTPLSLILNPLKKLIGSDDNNSRQHVYRVMRRNTERILHLISQLMDLRKIDKGKITLKFTETDMLKFARETTEIFEEQILAKHIIFQIHGEPNLPKVWIDQNYFDKPIQNLISNAIKFTPENGEIHLLIKIAESPDFNISSNPHLKITCSDSGIGLDESEMEKIFNRFYQAQNNLHQTEGTGIGLHLSKSIVELHHGTIHAENNPDRKGCRFIIRLPLGNQHLNPDEIETESKKPESFHDDKTIAPLPYEVSEASIVKSKGRERVLVVDDNEEVRQYICNELSSLYHMHECVNGKEALTFILKKAPDLIISDVVMPEMDGITLCRKIKQNVNINHIPVILLTAKSKEEDNLEGLGIGADAYIVKPFNIEILKKTVQNIIRNRQILRNNFSGGQEQKDKIKEVLLKSPDEKLLLKVIDIVNENIANPQLNVEMLTHEIGISRVHLHRKLKELTNQSTRDFIRNIRLNQAANLLSDNQHMNISEVAYAVGFINVAHFSNAFKEFFGVPPTVYMETHVKH